MGDGTWGLPAWGSVGGGGQLHCTTIMTHNNNICGALCEKPYLKAGQSIWLVQRARAEGLRDGCLGWAEGPRDAPPGWAWAPQGEREVGDGTEESY